MNESIIEAIVEVALPPEPETPEQVIARLAKLSKLEYEAVRDAEAKRLGFRASVLDDVVKDAWLSGGKSNPKKQPFDEFEPWPEPVNGGALLGEVCATIRRFIICEEQTAHAAALWIAFTWVIDHVQVAPLAVITAPEKRCGKSQLLDLIGRMARNPMIASNISPAATFRIIETHNPTLLIDEADSFMRDNEELRGVINSGHTRSSAYVIRCVGDDHEPTQFSTWGAKVLCGIGALPETIMDRAVLLELRRKLPSETVGRIRYAEAGLFARLSAKLARWAMDNGQAVHQARPVLPDALNDRAQDNWEPLLAIADCAGGDWSKLARLAALKISSGKQESVSPSAELLSDIQQVFANRTATKISTADLLTALTVDDLAPWATYNRGRAMSPRQLAKKLSEYGIKPTTIRTGRELSKGYSLSDFGDVFARYLHHPDASPDLSVTPLQNAEISMVTDSYAVTDKSPRYGNNNLSVTPNILNNNECYAVTDKNPSRGGYMMEVL